MAAHLEGKGSTTLDFTGLSQKNGAVTAHIKLAPTPADINVPRIVDGGAHLVLACDMVAAARFVGKMRAGVTRSIVNTAEVPVAAFTLNNDMYFPAEETKNEFIAASTAQDVDLIDATGMAQSLFGDTIATNLFMLGFAYQKGLIPLSEGSIERAIELNGVAIDLNQRAFRWGRLAGHDLAQVEDIVNGRAAPQPVNAVVLNTLDQQIEQYCKELEAYQNPAYAESYRVFVKKVREQERSALGGEGVLSKLVAKYLYKLMAYKDEYEVARLYASAEFSEKLNAQFSGDYKLQFHLAPPMIARKDQLTGNPKKITFGAWMLPVFKVLAKCKSLRGTAFDPFGYMQERRQERQLIEDYRQITERAMATVSDQNIDVVSELLALPEKIRGYGHVKDKSIHAVQERWNEFQPVAEQSKEPLISA